MITGINHITPAVRDPEESFIFYTSVLGFKALAKWPNGSYLLAGDMWIALVADDNARESVLPEYTHVAFSVSDSDYPELCRRISESGVEIWQDNRTEGDSFYFLDPNGHKLEIHASDLPTRLRSAREAPWEGLEFFDDDAMFHR